MQYTYTGKELELFSKAKRWKRYLNLLLRPYIGGHILEVGAGIGGTTAILCDGSQERWVCLEPDFHMAAQLRKSIESAQLPRVCETFQGTVADLTSGELFDTVLYIDVLEHILGDKKEIADAVGHLTPGGALIVVAPAHQWLYSPFDAAIGHYRRYNKATLSTMIPAHLRQVALLYIDSAGLLLSAGNRFILRKDSPTTRDIAVWDRWIIPISMRFDCLLRYSLGKSLLGIWRI